MSPSFDHEKLRVYQKTLAFVGEVSRSLDTFPKTAAVKNQLDRASTSILLNIAEGNGKWQAKDKCRFLDIARGSAVECAAAVDIGEIRGFLESEQATELKQKLFEITCMLVGLMKKWDPGREFGVVDVESSSN